MGAFTEVAIGAKTQDITRKTSAGDGLWGINGTHLAHKLGRFLDVLVQLKLWLLLLPNPVRERNGLRALCREVIGTGGGGDIADSEYG